MAKRSSPLSDDRLLNASESAAAPGGLADWRQLLATLFLLFSCVASPAAQGAAADNEPSLVIPRLAQAPKIDDFLDEAVADAPSNLAKVEGLVTRLPRDGEPISERTVTYLGYDDKNLYAIFMCFESDLDGIYGHLTTRDRFPGSDDSVAVQIDTFRDRKHAYGFQVNPAAVQLDAFWTEGAGWDLSWDTVWRTDSRLTPWGYVVFISVPFKSIRFPPEAIQEWGVLIFRGIARKNEQAFWPAYSTNIAGRMSQAARLDGLESVSPGRNAHFIPYVGGRNFRVLDVDDPEGPRFVSEDADIDAGIDAKVVFKDSVTLDATVNPDFSQVESDEPQVTVNKRFEVFFPEKRPFFLENASFFDTPIPLLFTRRILQPSVGARLTGRVGAYALGALVLADDPDAAPDADVGVLRINRDIGAESNLGMFFSTRDQEGNVNLVGGVDGRFKFAPNWVGSFQAAGSSNDVPDSDKVSGSAFFAALERTGENLNYNAVAKLIDPDFVSTLGFIERRDVLSLDQTLAYRFKPVDSRLLSWGGDIVVSEVRTHDNDSLDRSYTPKLAFEWSGQTNLTLFHEDSRVRLRPQEVPSVSEEMAFDQYRTGVELSTSFDRRITLGFNAAVGEAVNLVPPAGALPSLADLIEANLTASFRPTKRLGLDASYLLTRLEEPGSGERVFTDQIARFKVGFQFSRILSLRTIIQFNDLEVNPEATRIERRKNENFDVLLTWQQSPWTALFIGYNNNRANIDPSLTLTPNGLLRTQERLISDGSQFFVKLSYYLSPKGKRVGN